MMSELTRVRVHTTVCVVTVIGTILTYVLLTWALILIRNTVDFDEQVFTKRDVAISRAVCSVLALDTVSGSEGGRALEVAFGCPIRIGSK